ncbi:transcriptional regulator NrdR [Psychrobacter sanguinis]|jgi:transcriptional repressor NrdR|uniref:transcriptional regulator NrdR n=1 Tax=Psychrobacter sanguinis TaxID=861445 RepID=UPI00020C944D|nr:transcriptional regulator NrdR [Psychrobacter sanguinis]EGK12881.1 iron oxidase [Psychrobacter sp. 1501(2011)]HBH33049.1 transcriptional repressor NrdR [Psychrobacter sp.]MCC3309065.1 transcriptional regulator NrdR [Psychrobacter sanguinis]MCD9150208.1 transcriptional regulator NrdR [Psychrobacter sanguinis]UEC26350.1 transcriptional regulator NrdR [Psychrobacter sanguinis]
MQCPYCNADDTKVIDSRLAAEGAQVRRRRQCNQCQERFTTFEVVEVVMPRIIKSNNRIEPYDSQKLRRSIQLPLQKRPVTLDEQEAMISRIEKRIRQLGEREISSKALGEVVMSELKELDDVAYVRFASVYRDFQDIEAFRQELQNIRPSDNK